MQRKCECECENAENSRPDAKNQKKTEETLYPKKKLFHGVTGGRGVDHDPADADCASGSNLAVHAPFAASARRKKTGQVDENNAGE